MRLLVLLLRMAAVTYAVHGNWSTRFAHAGYFRRGTVQDTVTAPEGGMVLMGGGTDVDDAFLWMCKRSGGGDFLVIRATGTDAYNEYIEQVCGSYIASAATLIISTKQQAEDPATRSVIWFYYVY
jgi:cyanophycinase